MNDITNGQVLGRAFGMLARNPVGFGLAALLMVVIPDFLVEMLGRASGKATFLIGNDADGFPALLALLLVFLFKAIAILACIDAGETARPDMAAAARSTLPRILPLIGVSLLGWLVIIIGFILLIVPGIIAFCMLAVSVPVLLVEHRGVVESLSRSRSLTDGNKGMIFLLYFLFGILQGAATAIVSLIVSVSGNGDILRSAAAALLAAAVATIDAAICASLYIELRTAKEGGLSDELVQVFE